MPIALGSAPERLRERPSQLIVSKHKLRQVEAVQTVRVNRDAGTQTLGFASRPFVACGLPVKRPPAGTLLHEMRNGQFVLQVTGHPEYGLPWGQDRLVPLFLATLAIRQQSQTISFASAAEMLDTFGLGQGGAQYRRPIESFKRIFGATIFFGTDCQRERALVFHQSRFNFMSEARIWYPRSSLRQSGRSHRDACSSAHACSFELASLVSAALSGMAPVVRSPESVTLLPAESRQCSVDLRPILPKAARCPRASADTPSAIQEDVWYG